MSSSDFTTVINLTSLLLACAGLLVLAGGVWIVADHQAITDAADQIKDDLENVEDLFSISEDYYSAFNKKGGWINVAYVMVGVGAVTFAVAFLGFIVVHNETVFLLFTYISPPYDHHYAPDCYSNPH